MKDYFENIIFLSELFENIFFIVGRLPDRIQESQNPLENCGDPQISKG